MNRLRFWFMWHIGLPLVKWGNLRERKRLLKRQMDLPRELTKVERMIKTNEEEYTELDRYEELLRKYKEENK